MIEARIGAIVDRLPGGAAGGHIAVLDGGQDEIVSLTLRDQDRRCDRLQG